LFALGQTGFQKGGHMLQIQNLTITHKKDLRVILQDFSCVLNNGDKAVIIGEEGNGKSTLLRWIYDSHLVEEYAEFEGSKIVSKERMGYLPQELATTDKEKSVYEYFCDAASFYEKTPAELSRLAGSVRMPSDFFYSDQRMGSLSGGEKIKAQMLRILMDDPTVLLLDEPSNDIDIETLEWLEQVINGWKHIVLFISHDETLIEHTANMVIHIEQVSRKTKSRYTVVRMPYRQYMTDRAGQFERQRQQAINDRNQKRLRDEKFRRIYQSVDHAQTVISRQAPAVGAALKKKMHTVKSLEKRFEREDENMTQMPEQEDAIFFKLGDKNSSIPTGKTVLDYTLDKLTVSELILSEDIHLLVKGPQKICIIGTNGAGKTTLLKKIAEKLLARNDIRAEYMPQNYEELLDLSMTPVDFLDQTGDKETRTHIRTYLGSLKYTADEMAHPIAELSGGQKAKILLLKMSLSGANVLILDEPTRNFSPLSGPVIRKMLAEFPGAIISISHDRRYIEEVCDRVLRLTEKGLIAVDDF